MERESNTQSTQSSLVDNLRHDGNDNNDGDDDDGADDDGHDG